MSLLYAFMYLGMKGEQVEPAVNEQNQKRHIHVTSEKVIETALVVDKQTLDYHGNYEDLVAYMLDIMSVVRGVYALRICTCINYTNCCFRVRQQLHLKSDTMQAAALSS